ncbi:MAG: 16S rRNA (cytidine(1402)-2'-O)-methyltransferase [Oscillospiraceae bacterium]|jgi:16S rRNA (cytidine1402-2'-O)-methyltransferase|nr:16S rRNA (cytidine(1402)-2'-O)-methyltransferase [Oscillospiraceae bacterium]
MGGLLYIVGTPIGNLSDMSPRAVQTLEDCDFIAAEDTRVTLKILNHFEIKKHMLSYFDHNKLKRGEEITQRILNGETCALVTDAGMPAISDPGEELVSKCHNLGIDVKVVPGPCAFVSAIAVSGMPGGRFCFEGFLSMNKTDRKKHLLSLAQERRTIVFYEAPHKLKATIADLLETLGNRDIAIVRELTKIHEEVILTTLEDAALEYSQTQLKGEIVLIVAGACEDCPQSIELKTAASLIKEMTQGGLPLNKSCKIAAELSGLKKNDIYSYFQKNFH